jgi:TRAP-type C4-dicarboxylate transport system permease small subunit
MAFVTIEEPAAAIGSRWNMLKVVRRVLDAAYLWSAYLAAASMVVILLLTLLQIVSRYLGISIRGLSDYAGYFMASAAFLAFAHTLNRGAHVRIELFLGMFGNFRAVAETVSLGFSSLIGCWFAYYAANMVYWTYAYGDISTGLDATPLWIPQAAMAVGSILFAIALVDNFLQRILTGCNQIKSTAGSH